MKPKKVEKNLENMRDERTVRLRKMRELQALGIDPYGSAVMRNQSAKEALAMDEKSLVSLAGRMMWKRDIGKITFCHLQDETGKIQLVFNENNLGKENYGLFLKHIDAGDILWVNGNRFVTKAGEQSVLVIRWLLLTKMLLSLPDKYHGLQEEELRLRKRYLEFLLSPELRDLFRRKAVFWNAMREFLHAEGFLEVETPVLETTAGGADATPFVTHHNALDIDVFLRISVGELWQKRLMVGGFEKTFEIGRIFRNEGMSREHLQDYTSMEFYWAYADYEKGMDLVERMYKEVIQKTLGRLMFDIGEFKNIDLGSTWGRIDYRTIVKEKTGVDVLKASAAELKKALKKLHVSFDEKADRGRLIDMLWKHCRKTIQGPVFLIHHPVAVSPLAKRLTDNPDLTERYQIIIAGSELGNGYSELNDPIDQAERFAEQAKLRAAGDREAQMPDHDFVEALEHGMPPTTGFGVSERLFAFLENKSVRDCQLFPLLKPSTE